MPEFFAPLFDWLALHPHWLGASVFLIILIECTALIGVLWPGVLLVFAAALLAAQIDMALWPLLLLAWLAAFIGNAGSFLLGTRLQDSARSLPLLRRHPHWLARAELHLENYGAASLFVGHFIGPLRPVLPLLAGMLRMSRVQFLLTNLYAAGIWSFSAVLPGWLAGSTLDTSSAPPEGFRLQAIVLAGSLLMLAIAASWLGRHRHPRRHPLLALLAGLLLTGLLLGWQQFSTFDLYLQKQILSLSANWLNPIMLAATQLGDVKLQFILCAILCGLLVIFRARTALLFAVITLLGATLGNALLKKLVMRDRPQLLPLPLDGYSLPSGHSVRAFTFFLVIAILAGLGRRWQIRMGLVLLACLPATSIAFSRVYLTAHWPTDILAGALLAIFSCSASLALLERLNLAPSTWPSVKRFWSVQAGLSALAYLLFLGWSFSAAALKYNLS